MSSAESATYSELITEFCYPALINRCTTDKCMQRWRVYIKKSDKPNQIAGQQGKTAVFQRLFAFLRHNDKSSIGHPLAYNEQPTFFLTKAKRGTQGLFKHFPLCLSLRQNVCCEKSKVPQVKINWWIVRWSLFEVHCGHIPQPGNTRMALLFAA